MRLPSPVLTTVQQFAAAFPIPRGDGGEAWIESALRQGWTKRMVEQVVFSHGPTWGRKAQSSSHPVSKEALALNDGGLHVWDLLVGAGSGRPTLATDPAYHFVPEQLFIPVPGVDHLGAIAPPADRPTIAVPLWGIDSFDLGVRVQAGDTRWITEVMVPNGLVGRTVCASRFRAPRSLYQGLVQTDLACAALREAKGRSEFVLLCDTAEYGLTRADVLAQVTALNAIFLRYPEVVAGLQIGNENSHAVEQPYMSDPGFLAEVEARIDKGFPVARGAGHGGEGVSMAGGSYLVHHPDRSLSPAANGLIMAEAQRVAKRPVLNSEDLGVAETARVPGRQRTDDVRFFERVVGVARQHQLGGVTWHGDAGMSANVDDLGPIQRDSIARFVAAAGSIVVPPSPGHPLLDSPLTYAFFIAHWREVLVEAAVWYTRATGTPPADPDLGHMLYRAFEEQARPAPRWTTLRGAWTEDKPGGAPR